MIKIEHWISLVIEVYMNKQKCYKLYGTNLPINRIKWKG
jgi:hypothetical protein